MTVPLGPPQVPEQFQHAVDDVRAALLDTTRPGLALHEVPAPKRLAPYAFAVAAEVVREQARGQDDVEIASGRFVVLHDPQGQEGWRGDTRIVVFVSAEVDAEMAADPALAEVGWSWLVEGLANRGSGYTAAGGTVTRTVSMRFGQIAEPVEASEIEVRASWTPLPDDDGAVRLTGHLQAWCDLLCATAGLPPPGVLALPGAR